MGERRVAITGIGCPSRNGTGRVAYAGALARGESGIGRITPGMNSALVVARGD